MSYTIDVFNRRVRAEKHLGKFALFVSFFPQLVAGPIERFAHLRPQLNGVVNFSGENLRNGLRLILFGFFLKLCIADNLAQTVNPVYLDPLNYSSLNIILGTFLFGFQIYGDFAGYSLIAQGSALLLGIKLMDNFRNPYLSTSIGEFWTRWHISLSTWFRDYVYIPLGGNRSKIKKWVFNIIVVFTISGFWHGAEWTFLIWGAIHALIYLLERLLKVISIPGNWRKFFGWPLTFISVSIAWIFFRADNLDAVNQIYTGILQNSGNLNLEFSHWFVLPASLFILFEIVLYNKRFDSWISSKPVAIRWSLYSVILFCILALGGAVNHPFIYFQF
jgi:D-alanyl-lipoteichoic acid acyltransferase DltB (MBOAT superfamily)